MTPRQGLIGLFGALIINLNCNALSLGAAPTSAKLGAALDVVIPIDSDALSPNEVSVTLASLATHQAQDVNFSAIPTDLQVVVAEHNDRLIAQVTTYRPIRQPVVEFILELRTPEGMMLRRYQLLLDP